MWSILAYRHTIPSKLIHVLLTSTVVHPWEQNKHNHNDSNQQINSSGNIHVRYAHPIIPYCIINMVQQLAICDWYPLKQLTA